MSILILAIPYYLILLGLEGWLAKRRKIELFHWRDTVTNLSLGLLSEIVAVFLKGLGFVAYTYVFTHFHVFELSSRSLLVWVVSFFAVDLCYYWFHRVSHRSAMFWAFHVVHHQSEEYNLSVALRQSALGSLVGWIFYLPLAFLGVSPTIYLVCYGINLLYQFWVHTRLITKMGAFEWLMNTPSHHRVHHASNVEYLDKNYAGTFIIWDRWFGSFIEEGHEPNYGITKPLGSWNPIWANIHYWVELYKTAKELPDLKNRLLIWFMPPGWRPGTVIEVKPSPRTSVGLFSNPGEESEAKGRASFGLGVLVATGGLFLLFSSQLGITLRLFVAIGLSLGLTGLSWQMTPYQSSRK